MGWVTAQATGVLAATGLSVLHGLLAAAGLPAGALDGALPPAAHAGLPPSKMQSVQYLPALGASFVWVQFDW